MKKNYFFGKYYKFVSNDGFCFAIIDSYSNDGFECQIITSERSYLLKDLKQIKVEKDFVEFDISQDDLKMEGKIEFKNLHPLKHNAMGPFQIFSMQCSHDIYSLYHDLSGTIKINNNEHCFDNGFGYIEGDKGNSFPSKYIWYNSVGNDYGVTVAIATIPFGLINFTGLLGFINYQGKEYRICTYNFGKIKEASKNKFIIKKGKYELEVNYDKAEGHNLKAPSEGCMSRVIKENVSVPSSFVFKKKNKVIVEKTDNNSSIELMM